MQYCMDAICYYLHVLKLFGGFVCCIWLKLPIEKTVHQCYSISEIELKFECLFCNQMASILGPKTVSITNVLTVQVSVDNII